MDSDFSKFKEYDTSHKVDFAPRQGKPAEQAMHTSQSFIPQGDPDKVRDTLSIYNDKYRPYDTLTAKPKRAECLHSSKNRVLLLVVA